MAIKLKNNASKIYLEKADNGVILCELAEDNTITSKILYEIHYPDGIIDLDRIGELLYDITENLNIQTEDIESNRELLISVEKINPNIPDPLDEDEDDEDSDDE